MLIHGFINKTMLYACLKALGSIDAIFVRNAYFYYKTKGFGLLYNKWSYIIWER